jgi:hypothetical protein
MLRVPSAGGLRSHSSSTSDVKACYFVENVVLPRGLSCAQASARSGIRM